MVNRKKPVRSPRGKKPDRKAAQPVSEEVFLRYVKVLEAKIEASRKDMGEQVNQLATGLGKRMGKIEGELKDVKDELHQTQKALRETRTDLMAEMMMVNGELGGLEKRLIGVDTRLGDKIDSIHVRVDDHEVRIATLEMPGK